MDLEHGIFSPRSKSSNRDCCVVNGCKSKAQKDITLRFHRFPRPNKHIVFVENIFGKSEKIDQLKAWKIALKIQAVTPRMKVCSLHFKKTDYILPDAVSQKRFLKKNAVPSCNLPVNSAKKINVKANEERRKRRIRRSEELENIIKAEHNHIIKAEQIIENKTQMDVNEEEKPVIQSANEMLIDKTAYTPTTQDTCMQVNNNVKPKMEKATCSTPSVKDVEVQVNSDYLNPSFLQNIKNDSQLNTVTGLESFDILNTIVDIVKLVYKDKFEKNNVRMNIRDRIIMTYMKLKQNISYSLLAIIFNCYSAKHCQRVFYETVKILSKCLKPIIRVHVERSNQRIKTFKILSSTMPVKLVPISEDIFTVVCATINMSSLILSDNNFMKT